MFARLVVMAEIMPMSCHGGARTPEIGEGPPQAGAVEGRPPRAPHPPRAPRAPRADGAPHRPAAAVLPRAPAARPVTVARPGPAPDPGSTGMRPPTGRGRRNGSAQGDHR
ncbi:hypothetical protein KNE206_16600 [Kitasatospora sp. NE20-6]